MNHTNVEAGSSTQARVICVPDVSLNKKWTGYSRNQLEEGIVDCHRKWVANGKPRILDSFMPSLVLGLKSNHSRCHEYGFIGRKVILSTIRRVFTRNDSCKINHFLLFKNHGLERIDHFFSTIISGIIKPQEAFDISYIQGTAKRDIGDLVLYDDFLNTLVWSENKLVHTLNDRMFFVDARFNTEELAYRKPTRLKDFRNFIFKSKDLKRDTKGISMHYTNRSFYYAGITWEKNFMASYRKMFDDAKSPNMAYPLMIDLMSHCNQAKVEYQSRKYISLDLLYRRVQDIIGEAYARVILGEDIPASSHTSLNGDALKDYEALAYFDGHYVENWNVVQKDNTLDIPIFEL